MKCPRCKTEDTKYFALMNGRYYCRRCIQFGRVFVDEDLKIPDISKNNKHVYYTLQYELSKRQQEVASRLVNNFKAGKNTVVLAVCGSGKTEIVYDVITEALNQGKSVCFAVPRKALVLELAERIERQFVGIVPTKFYGGYTGDINSPFILCTTHQLYRFHQSFDLLILDEIDAFPYRDNALLEDILFNSLKGQFIFMSATLDAKQFADTPLLILNRRYHLVDLPVPHWYNAKYKSEGLMILRLLKKWQKKVLIYVPRIKDLDKFDVYFKAFRYAKVSSKSKDSDQIIRDLREGRLDFIITTTLLERGITIEDVQVIVTHADHQVYTKEVLIQIAGRVGRSLKYPTGEVVFISKRKSRAISESIETIILLNKMNV